MPGCSTPPISSPARLARETGWSLSVRRSLVRTRLSAGGRWIRTIGTPYPPFDHPHSPPHRNRSFAPGTDGSNPAFSSAESVREPDFRALLSGLLVGLDDNARVVFGRRSAAIRRSNLREGAVRGNRRIDEVRRVRAADEIGRAHV